MSELSIKHKRGILLLATFVFLLFAAPRAGFRFGGIPVYLVDVVCAFMIAYAFTQPAVRRIRNPLLPTVSAIVFLAIFSEVSGIAEGANAAESVYLIGKFLLGTLVMFAVPRLVNQERDYVTLMKALTLAAILTSSLMIASSLPITRDLVNSTVFSIPFLEPATGNVIEKYTKEVYADSALRGRSLVGVSILSATFLNIAYPLIGVLALHRARLTTAWRRLVLMAVLLSPAAVLLSYSRGPILGFLLMVLVVMVLNGRRFLGNFAIPAAILAGVVGLYGVNSDAFMFDRLANRTAAALSDPYSDVREAERILAYSQPFEHLSQNPRFVFYGEGNAVRRGETEAAIDGQANHALFAAAYYVYGLIAAVLYHVLIVQVFLMAWATRQRSPPRTLTRELSESQLLMMVATLPWIAFGHAIATQPRGAMAFFFIVGLVVTLSNSLVKQRSQPSAVRSKANNPLPQSLQS